MIFKIFFIDYKMNKIISRLVKNGANKKIMNSFKKFVLNEKSGHRGYSDYVFKSVQLHAIHDNEVFDMSEKSNANLKNLEKCGLTKNGAKKFLKSWEKNLKGNQRLYKEVSDYLIYK
jgi:hypothetical protein